MLISHGIGSWRGSEATNFNGSCVYCGASYSGSWTAYNVRVDCKYCDGFTYYTFCNATCFRRYAGSAVIGEDNNGRYHNCPSVPRGCTRCEGTGERTNYILCSHGYTTTHSYCSHGYTTQHD